MPSYTGLLEELRLEDVALVGGKTASLGEMLGALRPLGILVAVDSSDSSRLALELAARIGDPKLDAIDVLHVSSMPRRLHATGGELVPVLERRRDEVAPDVRRQLLTFPGTVDANVRWNVTVKFGEPRAVILDEEAKQRGGDLLALGTKGRTGLARVLVGSVAEGVIRGAACDALVARLAEVRR